MASAKRTSNKCVEESEVNDAAIWVEANKATIPDAVYKVVVLMVSIRADLEKAKARASNLLGLFRRELGILPKSERGSVTDVDDPSSKSVLTPEEKLALLKERKKKLLGEIRRYQDRLGLSRKKGQKKKEATPDSKKGGKPKISDPAFQRSNESVFSGNLVSVVNEIRKLLVDKMNEFENPTGLHTVRDERKRYQYDVVTKTINLSVETVTDPRTGRSVTASTDEIGPPNSQATWAAIANTIISVIGYAIPINRLATMLETSCPYFSSTRICSYLKMAAEMFLPVYTHLGESELSDCEVLQGDDTKARVIEIQKALKNGGTLKEPVENSLVHQVSEIFGRVFAKKRGKGTKRSLNVSVVIGKSRVADPRSYVIFFRTHLGSLGDLLTKILENRDPKKKKLTILSDLSTTNLVSPKLYEKFDITHAGCSPHARRPFFRHKDKDQRLCYWMLSAFLILEKIEDHIDEIGRNRETILRYRKRYGEKIWLAIRKRCDSVMRGEKVYGHYWPKSSEIYLACQYIVKNHQELTQYIDDPRLPSNNNLSERVLRWEKIMQDSSKFRMTESGRLNVDILSTIVHTCSSAKVELKDYLYFIFKNRDQISESPQDYTPYSFALLLDKKSESVSVN